MNALLRRTGRAVADMAVTEIVRFNNNETVDWLATETLANELWQTGKHFAARHPDTTADVYDWAQALQDGLITTGLCNWKPAPVVSPEDLRRVGLALGVVATHLATLKKRKPGEYQHTVKLRSFCALLAGE